VIDEGCADGEFAVDGRRGRRDAALLMKIGNETYYKSSEGRLMPTRKDQPPPDLRYFKQMQK